MQQVQQCGMHPPLDLFLGHPPQSSQARSPLTRVGSRRRGRPAAMQVQWWAPWAGSAPKRWTGCSGSCSKGALSNDMLLIECIEHQNSLAVGLTLVLAGLWLSDNVFLLCLVIVKVKCSARHPLVCMYITGTNMQRSHATKTILCLRSNCVCVYCAGMSIIRGNASNVS